MAEDPETRENFHFVGHFFQCELNNNNGCQCYQDKIIDTESYSIEGNDENAEITSFDGEDGEIIESPSSGYDDDVEEVFEIEENGDKYQTIEAMMTSGNFELGRPILDDVIIGIEDDPFKLAEVMKYFFFVDQLRFKLSKYISKSC